MKKILVLGMVIVMALAMFAGCGQQEQGAADSQQGQQIEQQVPQQPAEPIDDQAAQEQQGMVVEDGVVMDPSEADLIGEDKAKQIALDKVEGASAEDLIRIDLDYDDGRWVYEGEIFLGEWEYEFEIDGESGNVIGWEKDHIYD